ncbi:excalibur calcium-binding domain-containing protein [Kribbella solani]|uniref:excalibur calcium-binding domain-containing protein n=1 Tax=Kribbella solani TaxID=236067 RepID=UPI0029BE1C80|nr:excalibur calcium-binding domain-containing protein [Kribbella solani]MDX2972971.1 excalibur calcium-binding domain-containing protein [Kribbella solani]MDX3006694.1 excalibur calcium-binding domain-containing protein [Kribbella solani]
MATFNSPPDWPEPPAPDWQPPPGWQPDPSWPAAPPGWAFWLNARGGRARGPSGRYGAESPAKLIAGWGAGAVAFVVILAAIGGNNAPAAVSPAPGATVTVAGPATTVTGPTVTVSVPGPATTVTRAPVPARTTTIPAPRTTSRMTKTTAPVPLARTTPTETSAYYKNCTAVRAAGKAPLYRGQPGYAAHLDRDGDGVACE